MTVLRCPFSDCSEEISEDDKDIAIAMFNAHVSTHTVNGRPRGSSSSSKSEKLTRPKLTQGMLEETWNSFKALWELYKTGAGLSAEECGLQLIYCCDDELMEQVVRADPLIVSKPEEEQLEAIKKLAVVPVAIGVRRSELFSMSQDLAESSRAFLSKIQGKAATCDFTTKCKCASGSSTVDFTSIIVKYVLVNGLADVEIQREILGWKSLDPSSLADTVAFIEQKEMARDAYKGEASGIRSSYKKQQQKSLTSSADEAKLRKKVKCGGCSSQINQYARSRSGRIGERKYCSDCWRTKQSAKKKEGGSSTKETDDSPDKVQHDELSSLFVNGNMLVPDQSTHRQQKIADGNKKRSRSKMETVSVASCKEVRIAETKKGPAVIIDHHIFDNDAGWQRRRAWKQPTLRMKARPCAEMYSQLNKETPDIEKVVVDGVADTGAQTCLWSMSEFYKAGYKKKDLIQVKQRIVAANRQPIEIKGAVFLTVEADSFSTNLMAYVTPDIQGFYLSRQVLTALHVIPPTFPRAGDALDDRKDGVSVNACVNQVECGCLPRTAPPSRPSRLPFPPMENNIPRMKQWLLQTFASSTFNRCPHQPLPFIKAEPICLHVDKDAKPVVHHTPGVLPIHWEDKVKKGLDEDERLGVIEKVPDGVPTTWLHRMVVVAKPSGEPRRTVDLSPLNKYCQRETHVTVPPFRQARLVPAGTWKSVTDAWNGYHSALIREEDKHLTSFITNWGRYRYRVAPQGYVSSGDGYSKRYDKIIESVARKAKITDDTILWDDDEKLEEHWWRTFDYLALVGSHGIVLNGEKFQFCSKTVDFAGFRISEHKVEPLPKYLEAIETFPTPQNISDVRSWFGLVNQVAHYAQLRDLVAPLKPLLSSKAKFYWTDELDKSFNESKQEIIRLIKNGVEIFDPNRPTKLHTDFSTKGLGFYLAQKYCSCKDLEPDCCTDGWRICLSGSRFLKAAESRYAPIEGECLGVS